MCPWPQGVVNFVILVAALSAMNSQLYITTRMMFSLARAGYAPRRFGELSARGTPVSALLLSSIGIALATVLNVLFPDTSFTLMFSIVDLRRAVHLDDDFCDPSVFPPGARGKPPGIPHVGLSVFEPFGRRVDGGDPADYGVHQRVPHDAGLWIAGAGPVLRGMANAEAVLFMNDPLLAWRKEFPILGHTTYMISHSLGAMPRRVSERLQEFADTWATRGIRAWEEGWWEMPVTVGDLIGSIIGAGQGEVVMHQNVSICQWIVTSCFDWRGPRNKLVTDGLNFPSNDYIYYGLERQGARVTRVARQTA